MEDKVYYEVPFSFISDIFIGWWIKKDVSSIFSYRTEILKKLIGPAIVHLDLTSSMDDQALRMNSDHLEINDDMNPIQ